MTENQPPAKWTVKTYTLSEAEDFVYEKGQKYAREVKSESEYFSQRDEDKAIDYIAKTQKFIALEDVEQLQSEAYEKGLKDEERAKRSLHQLEIEEARADERKKILNEMRSKLHPKMHNDVHYMMGHLTRICKEQPTVNNDLPTSVSERNVSVESKEDKR